MFEQEQPDHEACLDTGPSLVAIERRDLAIDPIPVNLGAELHQLMLQIDDLIEPGAKQIAVTRHLRLLWSHRPLRRDDGIMTRDLRESRK